MCTNVRTVTCALLQLSPSCVKRIDSSRFHEASMFPKDSERFGKFGKHSVDFIILHRIWDQKYGRKITLNGITGPKPYVKIV